MGLVAGAQCIIRMYDSWLTAGESVYGVVTREVRCHWVAGQHKS